ncbi:metalloregulator ArsR/SmtB family transcription factor [Bacillus toyonensis]|uniref:ArsR/SmtB family transcription factor n=1 Tax=Bacillus toyonensis TaxID=155322 RepID=UPI002E20C89E|nr:metalloregulator ArsR/SmtB family transcription factor [Bacillus toyonensis]
MIRKGSKVTVAIEDLEMIRTLSHPVRMQIAVELTLHKEYNVTDLMGILDLPQADVSTALKYLRGKKIVTFRKESQKRYYRLDNDKIRKIVEVLI